MRVRVAGVVVNDGRVLLVSTKRGQPGWMVPPGGGVERDEGLAEAVEREIREEAGIAVQAGRLLAWRELQTARGLALELYFSAVVTPAEADAATEGRQVQWVAVEDLATVPHYPEQLAQLARMANAPTTGAVALGMADLTAEPQGGTYK